MMKVKDSYNCDAVSTCAAAAAITDQEYAKDKWEYVRKERARLTKELNSMGWKVIPSQANFVLVNVPDNNGKAAYLGLKEQGILVRYFDRPGLTDKIRITVGTADENNALLAGIKSLEPAAVA
jgi:histidinol-phosphate aminotransferase